VRRSTSPLGCSSEVLWYCASSGQWSSGKLMKAQQKRTPKIGPRAKVESAPGNREEQANEQEDQAAA
jgi:hypothetical protein